MRLENVLCIWYVPIHIIVVELPDTHSCHPALFFESVRSSTSGPHWWGEGVVLRLICKDKRRNMTEHVNIISLSTSWKENVFFFLVLPHLALFSATELVLKIMTFQHNSSKYVVTRVPENCKHIWAPAKVCVPFIWTIQSYFLCKVYFKRLLSFNKNVNIKLFL